MWTRIFWKDGEPINHDPDNLIRTQDLDPIYEENSCLYLFSRDIFNKRENRLGFNPKMMVMDPIESIDIDEEHDFQLAEYFINH
jgi:N-acylneuraminate cytidylyltransferase